jgi:hypothetical protein
MLGRLLYDVCVGVDDAHKSYFRGNPYWPSARKFHILGNVIGGVGSPGRHEGGKAGPFSRKGSPGKEPSPTNTQSTQSLEASTSRTVQSSVTPQGDKLITFG